MIKSKTTIEMKHYILIFLVCILYVSGYSQNLTYAEYFFDTDPGTGYAIQLTTTDVALLEENFTINTTGLAEGYHTLNVRFKNAEDMWGPLKSRTFYIKTTEETNPVTAQITEAEYFYDNETSGIGQETALSGMPTGEAIEHTTTLDVPTETGYHTLYMRAKNNLGMWGPIKSRTFYIKTTEEINPETAQITEAEYFYDNETSGIGQETALSGLPTGEAIEHTTSLDVPTETGYHTLYVRAKNNLGMWGPIKSRTFYIKQASEGESTIVEFEYFTGEDPGFGNATKFNDFTPENPIDITFDAGTDITDPGTQFLYVRAKNANGNWSDIAIDSFEIVGCNLPDRPELPAGEASICYDYPNTEYTILEIADADSYEWSLEPSEAGTVTVNTITITIDWAETFEGDVQLKARGINTCGGGRWSEVLAISVAPDNNCYPNQYWLRSTEGNWHDPQNWAAQEDGYPVNTVPSKTKKVYIKGKAVVVDQNAESADIFLQPVAGETTGLSIDSALLKVYGSVKLEKTEEASNVQLDVKNGGNLECVEE